MVTRLATPSAALLLSSLEGAAVEAIQIDGVQHEFTTVEGVYEDVYLTSFLER